MCKYRALWLLRAGWQAACRAIMCTVQGTCISLPCSGQQCQAPKLHARQAPVVHAVRWGYSMYPDPAKPVHGENHAITVSESVHEASARQLKAH